MDIIQRFKETAIDKINMPTLAALIPVLDEHKAEIERIERKEFQYGKHSRHYLDVYYPPASAVSESTLSTPSGKLPVLFFIYGGGYNTGSRRFPEPYDMGYRALGSFFATRGFLVVIPDYRLVPEVTFPAASEDVRDALLWVVNHPREIGAGAGSGNSSRKATLDPGYVFMLAHSAGAAHTLVMTLYPPIRASLGLDNLKREDSAGAKAGLKLRGLVLSGSPWFYSVKGASFTTSGPVKSYFGGAAEQKEREPRALWAALPEDGVHTFPEVMLVQAEREPGWLRDETKELMEREMREKMKGVGREMRETYVARGHNHVSVNWVLGTGDREAEKWAHEVINWLKERITP